ncbi:HAD family hydrolase [Candidatus Woesearchaeota archaeon]|nr:HAD family hydrolase [Candidatus Woesearchaeota archaeon]
MSRLRALILDWDGVIADSEADQYAWLKHCATLVGKPFPFDKFDDDFKKNYNRYYAARGIHGLYDMLGINFEESKKQIWEAYEQWKKQAKINLFPQMKETIQHIYEHSRPCQGRPQGLRICLNTTNRFSIIQQTYLDNWLDKYFDTTVTRDILPEDKTAILTKPHAYSIEWCLDLLNCNSDEAISVGDTGTDIIACRTLRRRNPDKIQTVKTIAVTWGYETKEELEQHKPDYFIDKPEQLITIVKELSGID